MPKQMCDADTDSDTAPGVASNPNSRAKRKRKPRYIDVMAACSDSEEDSGSEDFGSEDSEDRKFIDDTQREADDPSMYARLDAEWDSPSFATESGSRGELPSASPVCEGSPPVSMPWGEESDDGEVKDFDPFSSSHCRPPPSPVRDSFPSPASREKGAPFSTAEIDTSGSGWKGNSGPMGAVRATDLSGAKPHFSQFLGQAFGTAYNSQAQAWDKKSPFHCGLELKYKWNENLYFPPVPPEALKFLAMEVKWGSVDALHFYEIIPNTVAYPVKLYLDIEWFTKDGIRGPAEDVAEVVSAVKRAVQDILKSLGKPTSQAAGVIMCGSRLVKKNNGFKGYKNSIHFVFDEIVCKDVHVLKLLVDHIVLKLRASNPAWAQYVDTLVYSKNRAMRCIWSSKDDNVPLSLRDWDDFKVTINPADLPLEEVILWISRSTCSLVEGPPTFDESDAQRLGELHSVSTPVTTRPKKRARTSRNGQSPEAKKSAFPNSGNGPPRWLEPLMNVLSKQCDGACDGNLRWDSVQTLGNGNVLVPTCCRECNIGGGKRRHSSNHVYFLVYVSEQKVVQRCHHSAHKQKQHRVPISGDIWEKVRELERSVFTPFCVPAPSDTKA